MTRYRYRCRHCDQILLRPSTKAWLKSFCERSGKTVRITRMKK